jgi:hypothetical protein
VIGPEVTAVTVNVVDVAAFVAVSAVVKEVVVVGKQITSHAPEPLVRKSTTTWADVELPESIVPLGGRFAPIAEVTRRILAKSTTRLIAPLATNIF